MFARIAKGDVEGNYRTWYGEDGVDDHDCRSESEIEERMDPRFPCYESDYGSDDYYLDIGEPEEEVEKTGPTELPKMDLNNSYEVSAATGTDIPEPWSNEWVSSS